MVEYKIENLWVGGSNPPYDNFNFILKMIYILLKSYNDKLLKKCCKRIKKQKRFSRLVGPIFLPKKKKRYVVIRSSHIFSLSREQFEICTHRRLFIFKKNLYFTNCRSNRKKKKHLPLFFFNTYRKFIRKIPVGISLKLRVKA